MRVPTENEGEGNKSECQQAPRSAPNRGATRRREDEGLHGHRQVERNRTKAHSKSLAFKVSDLADLGGAAE